jgi:hypothetical protein
LKIISIISANVKKLNPKYKPRVPPLIKRKDYIKKKAHMKMAKSYFGAKPS